MIGGTSLKVYIDGDWLLNASRRSHFEINYESLHRYLSQKFGKSIEVLYYGSIDKRFKSHQNFHRFLKKVGYTVTSFYLNKEGSSKGLEIQIVCDVIKCINSTEEVVIITGDGDYAPMVRMLILNKVKVHLISIPKSVNFELKKLINGKYLNFPEKVKVPFSKSHSIVVLKNNHTFTPESLYISKGEGSEADKFIRTVINRSKKSLTIIDPYLKVSILSLLHKKSVLTTLIAKQFNNEFRSTSEELMKQGYRIKLYETNVFHDRFIISDDYFYHSGHSFMDLGNKDSMINKIGKSQQSKLKETLIDINPKILT